MATKSNNSKHQQKSQVLRLLRKDSDLTQEQLATHLNISRETVVAVENCHLGAISALPGDVMESWWQLCREKASMESKGEFQKLITSLYPF